MCPFDPSEAGPLSKGMDDSAWTREVHEALRVLARRHLSVEADDITFSPTDLVHEAYLRLSGLRMPFADRQHFIRVASTQMRRVLVDHARRKLSRKRGGRPIHITLRAADAESAVDVRVVELDQLLTDLARLDPRKARIAEMHYFGGFTQDEVADGMSLSISTIERELKFLRGWLHHQLAGPSAAPDAGC